MTYPTPSSTTNRSFERVAWCYDFLASLVFGNAQRRAQYYFLPLIPDTARVLLIGGGSGWLLNQLLQQRPQVNVLYLEASGKMIQLAQKRVERLDTRKIEWRCGTEQSLNKSEQFDVLITPFILDLFTEEQLIQAFLPAVLSSLTPQGTWLCTDFVSSDTWWKTLLEKGMYWFFRPLARLNGNRFPNFRSCFTYFGFQRQASKLFYRGFIEANVLVRKQYKGP